MTKFLTTAAILATLMTPATAGEMKCPNGFAAQVNDFSYFKQPYFKCDFITKTCERGLLNYEGDARVFELLASDRTTVIGHYMCGRGYCFDYDSGKLTNNRLQMEGLEAMHCNMPSKRG